MTKVPTYKLGAGLSPPPLAARENFQKALVLAQEALAMRSS